MTREDHLLQLLADRGPGTLAGLLGPIVPVWAAEAAIRLEKAGHVAREVRTGVYAVTDSGRAAASGVVSGLQATGRDRGDMPMRIADAIPRGRHGGVPGEAVGMSTLVTGREAEHLLGLRYGRISTYVRNGKLKPVLQKKASFFRPPQMFDRAAVMGLRAELDAERGRKAAHVHRRERERKAKTAQLAELTEGRSFDYIPVEDRVEPATHYGLLTDSDMREISRRRGKRAA